MPKDVFLHSAYLKKAKREEKEHRKQRLFVETLRNREEEFIPMTYNEYENVHKAKHAEAANHYILCDWTSHNDFYRLKTHKRRDEDGSIHQRNTRPGPIPVGILREEARTTCRGYRRWGAIRNLQPTLSPIEWTPINR